MSPSFDAISKIVPPREAWRLKVRVIRAWIVPSFGNPDSPNSMELILVDENSNKIQATIRKQLINRFKDNIIEGNCYKMCYFSVVPNHGSYRATKHEFKLTFLFQTIVTTLPDDIIPRVCFTLYPFEEILQMSQDHDYLVDVIGLLTLVGEEKSYDKDGKTIKMVVAELSSQKMVLRCALFGEYVDQLNHFLSSGYVEQPVVILQLAKVKLFRGQPGLQNVMKATKIYLNPDLAAVVDFRKSVVEQGINGTQPLFIANEGKTISLEDDFMRLTKKSTIDELQENKEDGTFVILGTITDVVEEGCWWYSTCVCGKTVHPESGVYFCDMCMHHVTNVIPRYRLKVVVSDETGQGIFVLFDRETTYLVKKTCADLFNEVHKDSKDAPVPVFGPELGETSNTKCVENTVMSSFLQKEANVAGLDDIHLDMEGVKEVDIQDHSVDSDENVVLSDDIGSLIRSDVDETQDLLSHLLDDSRKVNVPNVVPKDAVFLKVKRNLEADFDKELEDTVAHCSKIIKIEDNSICGSDANVDIDIDWINVEFLNQIKCSGLPNHSLKLKKGVPVILLRNIDAAGGLCNGTRLIVHSLGRNVITADIVSGSNVGDRV
ncbi:replication protein A 70 kDa DNA-binding subunit B-like [Arachis duranensis]|uniref:Replication protein A 70 kDa DNA-binding subunit B-like n=1 Tax=Arachis duranensis TaxID=130453 RepID=A0A9C6WKD5_ARADU|nr:replication protein A 70 kDa DNA-binding subunit B-like [Arachis duranensis]